MDEDEIIKALETVNLTSSSQIIKLRWFYLIVLFFKINWKLNSKKAINYNCTLYVCCLSSLGWYETTVMQIFSYSYTLGLSFQELWDGGDFIDYH